jgi:hypothetical protein
MLENISFSFFKHENHLYISLLICLTYCLRSFTFPLQVALVGFLAVLGASALSTKKASKKKAKVQAGGEHEDHAEGESDDEGLLSTPQKKKTPRKTSRSQHLGTTMTPSGRRSNRIAQKAKTPRKED